MNRSDLNTRIQQLFTDVAVAQRHHKENRLREFTASRLLQPSLRALENADNKDDFADDVARFEAALQAKLTELNTPVDVKAVEADAVQKYTKLVDLFRQQGGDYWDGYLHFQARHPSDIQQVEAYIQEQQAQGVPIKLERDQTENFEHLYVMTSLQGALEITEQIHTEMELWKNRYHYDVHTQYLVPDFTEQVKNCREAPGTFRYEAAQAIGWAQHFNHQFKSADDIVKLIFEGPEDINVLMCNYTAGDNNLLLRKGQSIRAQDVALEELEQTKLANADQTPESAPAP